MGYHVAQALAGLNILSKGNSSIHNYALIMYVMIPYTWEKRALNCTRMCAMSLRGFFVTDLLWNGPNENTRYHTAVHATFARRCVLLCQLHSCREHAHSRIITMWRHAQRSTKNIVNGLTRLVKHITTCHCLRINETG